MSSDKTLGFSTAPFLELATFRMSSLLSSLAPLTAMARMRGFSTTFMTSFLPPEASRRMAFTSSK